MKHDLTIADFTKIDGEVLHRFIISRRSDNQLELGDLLSFLDHAPHELEVNVTHYDEAPQEE